jgi:hypothetical protein
MLVGRAATVLTGILFIRQGRPSSCRGRASVQSQWVVPSRLNEMLMFMVLIFDVAVE